MLLDLQNATSATAIPDKMQFISWLDAATDKLGKHSDAEVTIRLVDNNEIQQLNKDYRGKDQPTNVLSFPFEPYEALMAYAGDAADINLLGDIVIAPKVIEREAAQQNKALIHHYAHMTIHGLLHLLGYDHIEADEAAVMEALEIELLSSLDIPNPYENASDIN